MSNDLKLREAARKMFMQGADTRRVIQDSRVIVAGGSAVVARMIETERDADVIRRLACSFAGVTR